MRISVGKETKLQLILGTKVEVTSGAVITVTITIVKDKLIDFISSDGKISLYLHKYTQILVRGRSGQREYIVRGQLQNVSQRGSNYMTKGNFCLCKFDQEIWILWI